MSYLNLLWLNPRRDNYLNWGYDIRLTCTLVLLLQFICAYGSPIEVKVGGYQFEPFLFQEANGKWQGATVQLIDQLNRSQTSFHFKFVPTSPKRRFKDMDRGLFDIMLYEQAEWGWNERSVVMTQPFYQGGELYVALKKDGINQSFFKDLKSKRIAAVRGFHYGFANFTSDSEQMKKDFKVDFVPSCSAAIGMILKGRAEIAVVSRLFLKNLFSNGTFSPSQFVVSKNFDQRYNLRAILRVDSPIKTTRLSQLINDVIALNKNGATRTPPLD